MIFGGILGALVIPLLSDRYRRRVPFLITAVLGATVGLVGVTYAGTYPLLLISSFIFGFFLLECRTDRLPIWHGDHLSGAGGPPMVCSYSWDKFRVSFYRPRYGCLQSA